MQKKLGRSFFKRLTFFEGVAVSSAIDKLSDLRFPPSDIMDQRNDIVTDLDGLDDKCAINAEREVTRTGCK